ncbi:acylneuraminate cytidylyltransferase family protein [Alphaproteobacteria bacterium]|nr:acylneuraminate cytidylyltransferase family protein [Alphaproteobacteria bacterium]MDC0861398.1 acylneuraminate cytidylyltransferase family protein [Alphaproteobacteria bacterium]
MNNKFVALIPARGGSKGVPGKNIRNLSGHPMISYSIIASKLSKKISETIVSTDSKEIAKIAKAYGASVPFMRPSAIAKDNSTDIEFVLHAINWFKKKRKFIPEYWVILRPTTPLRNPKLINESVEKILKYKDSTSLVSVHEIPETPAKMFGLNGNYLHGLSPFDPRKEYYTLPRQQFPPTFSGNGYVDIVRTSTIINNNMFYGDKILSFRTEEVNEIDVLNDIKRLEQNLGIEKNVIKKHLEKNYPI